MLSNISEFEFSVQDILLLLPYTLPNYYVKSTYNYTSKYTQLKFLQTLKIFSGDF